MDEFEVRLILNLSNIIKSTKFKIYAYGTEFNLIFLPTYGIQVDLKALH